MQAIVYGVIASLFFAFTFILNRAMEIGGGDWMWSASLRFWFMAPMLFVLVALRGQLRQSLSHLSQNIGTYLLWSTLGFGLFYALITLASTYGPGWLVAGTWQFTIIAGSLLVPWLGVKGEPRHKIPWYGLRWSLLILLGIALMLWQQAEHISVFQAVAGLVPVLVAAFLYPLGNRKMMNICHHNVDTLQRVLNMTLASLPFKLLLSLVAYQRVGWPSTTQVEQSVLVALFSGVIGTLLFFAATNIVRNDPTQLAAVEATQSGEVLFTLLGEMIFLGAALPAPISLLGITLVILGMIAHSLASTRGSGKTRVRRKTANQKIEEHT
ncbi:DMT family transporter [Hafnia paralvei]|uniref:DMT family transporter n=1 Tax=Hafnia paralvei TaxID=546367 RepID=UPI002671FB1E|nr:multidrug resistance efflux transporter family protein [Hafnia paralvei]